MTVSLTSAITLANTLRNTGEIDALLTLPFTMDSIVKLDCKPATYDFRFVWMRDNITLQEMREIKRDFGPLEFEENVGDKTGKGKRLGITAGPVHEPITINVYVVIYSYMTCKEVEINPDDEVTPAQVDHIIDRLKRGQMKMIECTPGDLVDEENLCSIPDCRDAKIKLGKCWKHATEEENAALAGQDAAPESDDDPNKMPF